MSYRFLAFILFIIFGIGFILIQIGRFLPRAIDVNADIIGTIMFYLFVVLLIVFVIFEIQKARHPENFLPPANENEINYERQEIKQYGGPALIKNLFKSVYEKEKVLLSKVESAPDSHRPKFTMKYIIICFAIPILVTASILFFYIYFSDMRKNNFKEYNKISMFIDKISNTSIYKFIDKIGSSHSGQYYNY